MKAVSHEQRTRRDRQLGRGQTVSKALRLVLCLVLFPTLTFLFIMIAQSLFIRPGAAYFQSTSSTVKVSAPALRYQLLARFGKILFCDPDYYPLGTSPASETARAIEAFPAIQRDPVLFRAIVRHLALAYGADFSDQQKLLVYREYKKLRWGIMLSPLRGKYQFSLLVSSNTPGYEGKLGLRTEGTIDYRGSIMVTKRQEEYLSCPICLAGRTLIDTPRGRIPVGDLTPGVMVWTVNLTGERRPARIIRTSKTRVPIGHEMIDLILDDGHELFASPGHPTIDGRAIGRLSARDHVDGRQVVSAKLSLYSEDYTYDILPEGDTGGYWADGILLRSTLFDREAASIHGLAGILSGRVSIGPLCPVEPCPVATPDVYSSRKLNLRADGGSPIDVKLNPDGTFRARVRAGTYRVDLTDCVFLGCKYALPRTVTIKPEEITTLTISIETGIR